MCHAFKLVCIRVQMWQDSSIHSKIPQKCKTCLLMQEDATWSSPESMQACLTCTYAHATFQILEKTCKDNRIHQKASNDRNPSHLPGGSTRLHTEEPQRLRNLSDALAICNHTHSVWNSTKTTAKTAEIVSIPQTSRSHRTHLLAQRYSVQAWQTAWETIQKHWNMHAHAEWWKQPEIGWNHKQKCQIASNGAEDAKLTCWAWNCNVKASMDNGNVLGSMGMMHTYCKRCWPKPWRQNQKIVFGQVVEALSIVRRTTQRVSRAWNRVNAQPNSAYMHLPCLWRAVPENQVPFQTPKETGRIH